MFLTHGCNCSLPLWSPAQQGQNVHLPRVGQSSMVVNRHQQACAGKCHESWRNLLFSSFIFARTTACDSGMEVAAKFHFSSWPMMGANGQPPVGLIGSSQRTAFMVFAQGSETLEAWASKGTCSPPFKGEEMASWPSTNTWTAGTWGYWFGTSVKDNSKTRTCIQYVLLPIHLHLHFHEQIHIKRKIPMPIHMPNNLQNIQICIYVTAACVCVCIYVTATCICTFIELVCRMCTLHFIVQMLARQKNMLGKVRNRSQMRDQIVKEYIAFKYTHSTDTTTQNHLVA